MLYGYLGADEQGAGCLKSTKASINAALAAQYMLQKSREEGRDYEQQIIYHQRQALLNGGLFAFV